MSELTIKKKTSFLREGISPLKKIYEDDWLIVFDKPIGLVVNRSSTALSGTLQDYMDESGVTIPDEEVDEAEPAEYESDFASRSGIVHRLDKDTSGVLVVAKDIETFKDLQKQFKNRQVKKTYIALVNGRVEEPLLEIDAPIKRNPKNFLKLAVVADGRSAQTDIEKIKDVVIEDQKFTLVKVFPKTGRTHQIRVHLTAISHPVAGDPIYCTANVLKMNEKYFNRLMLHALSITIKHPKTGEFVEYTAELPSEFNL
jgi:23S rRNA pseudouridine1911/1915/1917 synthase